MKARMMRPLFALAVLFVACAAAPSESAVQPLTPRFVVLEDAVHEWLASDWDAHVREWPMIERGRCVQYDVIVWGGGPAFRVFNIGRPVVERGPMPGGVTFACPKLPNIAGLHTHLPQSCDTAEGPCSPGGLYAHQCFPSDQDRANLRRSGDAFALIQCDRYAVVAYWPDQAH
jgi:hypothetical protein